MKQGLAFIVFIFIFILTGCTGSQPPQPVCNDPYILVGTSCCLDQDNNSICDKDENAVKQTGLSESSNLLDTEEPRKTALEFARRWEYKEFATFYDLFTEQLKEMKTKEEFVFVMSLQETDDILSVRLSEINVIDSTSAYAYYDVQGSRLYEAKFPSIKFTKNGDVWAINSFASIFNESLIQSCKNVCRTEEECNSCYIAAAKINNDTEMCEQTRCGMDECYAELGRLWDRSAEETMCKVCTTDKEFYFEECAVDYAFKYQNMSHCEKTSFEGNTADCYGHFAAYQSNMTICFNLTVLSDQKNCVIQAVSDNPKLSLNCEARLKGACESTPTDFTEKESFEEAIAYYQENVWN